MSEAGCRHGWWYADLSGTKICKGKSIYIDVGNADIAGANTCPTKKTILALTSAEPQTKKLNTNNSQSQLRPHITTKTTIKYTNPYNQFHNMKLTLHPSQ